MKHRYSSEVLNPSCSRREFLKDTGRLALVLSLYPGGLVPRVSEPPIKQVDQESVPETVLNYERLNQALSQLGYEPTRKDAEFSPLCFFQAVEQASVDDRENQERTPLGAFANEWLGKKLEFSWNARLYEHYLRERRSVLACTYKDTLTPKKTEGINGYLLLGEKLISSTVPEGEDDTSIANFQELMREFDRRLSPNLSRQLLVYDEHIGELPDGAGAWAAFVANWIANSKVTPFEDKPTDLWHERCHESLLSGKILTRWFQNEIASSDFLKDKALTSDPEKVLNSVTVTVEQIAHLVDIKDQVSPIRYWRMAIHLLEEILSETALEKVKQTPGFEWNDDNVDELIRVWNDSPEELDRSQEEVIEQLMNSDNWKLRLTIEEESTGMIIKSASAPLEILSLIRKMPKEHVELGQYSTLRTMAMDNMYHYLYDPPKGLLTNPNQGPDGGPKPKWVEADKEKFLNDEIAVAKLKVMLANAQEMGSEIETIEDLLAEVMRVDNRLKCYFDRLNGKEDDSE